MNNRKLNKIFYSIVPKGEDFILNLSLDSKNSKLLKDLFEKIEKEFNVDLEGEIIYGATYSNLKILIKGDLEKYKKYFYSFIELLKKNNYDDK